MSRLMPIENFSPERFSVEIIFRFSIPDIIQNWRAFDDDDDQIKYFLTLEDTFKGSIIDEDQHICQL